MKYNLSNEMVGLVVDSHGAELCSIRFGGQEYLWQADPAFWGRHSPVLFPIVGRVWENVFRVDGKTYELGQHGFARDMEFEFAGRSENELWFRLESSAETLEKFPFRFALEIGYRLTGRKIDVLWRVRNLGPVGASGGAAGSGRAVESDAGIVAGGASGEGKMPFQIGAHPAFYYPEFRAEDDLHGYFSFGDVKEFEYILVKEKGCADVFSRHRLALEDGFLPLDQHVFDADALIVDNAQVQEVTLCDRSRRPWLKLAFDAPVVGLWSPPGKNAPFVCIEPWYGRCDRVGYVGDFRDKDWVMSLEPGETFERSYSIEVGL